MSRTTLCGITAAILAVLSVGVMVLRHNVMGDEVDLPSGPNVWKVTMTAQAHVDRDGRIWTATPLDVNRQHVIREKYRSAQLLVRPPEARNPQRRRVLWMPKAGHTDAVVKLHCEFWCAVDHRPTAPMTQLARTLYAPPAAGECLESELKTTKETQQITDLARRLSGDAAEPFDMARPIFEFVDREIANEPTIHDSGNAAGPVQCLAEGSGDAAAKSRLLLALLRNRGIPSRLVTGITLHRGPRQSAHYWVEAWLHERWTPLCPFYHHFGKLPLTYLVFGFGDMPLVRGKNVRDIESAFLVERVHDLEAEQQASPSFARKCFRAVSLYMLPPAEQRLVEFLLLLPVAALIICLFRNVIGLNSFGTFAPALLGLAFRDMPAISGFFVFGSILLLGWLLRRVLDRYHLLQVPRVALMLTLVVLMLIVGVVAANHLEMPATRYISLFPLVILTGMIERFWTLEAEDGTLASFKTLFITMLIAATVAVTLGSPAILHHLFRFPETLGIVMAGLLVIGRYTGYRLSELFRFRELAACG